MRGKGGGATHWAGGCRCRRWARSRRCGGGSGWATSAACPAAPASARHWSSSAVKKKHTHTHTERFGSPARTIISSLRTQEFCLLLLFIGRTSRSSNAERVCIPRRSVSLGSGRRKPGMACRTDSAPGSGRPHWCRGINHAGTPAREAAPRGGTLAGL